MKLNSKITFFNEGEVILVMDQQEGILVMDQQEGQLNGGHNKQFIFTLFNSENRKLGVLDPKLTKGYGYNRAIWYVGKALLAIFPKLQLEINSYHGTGSVSSFKWTTREIELFVADEPF